MNIYGWSQLAVFIGILLMLTKPIGIYLVQVLDIDGKPFLGPVLRPLERLLYRLFGLDPKKEQSWQEYTISLLAFSLVSLLATYAILRLQHLLPLNPQRFGPVSEHLAFNTAASFTTNTNWQSYGGESTLSYFSQMVGLVFHNFTSAAVGIAVAAVLVRGIARQSARTIGNFWSRPCPREHLSPPADLDRLCPVSRFPGHDSEFQALRYGAACGSLRHSSSQDGCRGSWNY